jgi:hypothetical protein
MVLGETGRDVVVVVVVVVWKIGQCDRKLIVENCVLIEEFSMLYRFGINPDHALPMNIRYSRAVSLV